MYKYVPNLESLLTQQYVCVRCTLWSDNTCVFTRFHSVKNANTQLIWSSAYITEDYTSLCLNIICNRSFFILKWCQLCSGPSFTQGWKHIYLPHAQTAIYDSKLKLCLKRGISRQLGHDAVVPIWMREFSNWRDH